MNKDFEKFIAEAKKVKFLPEEKTQVRGLLLKFIKDHSVRESGFFRQIYQRLNILKVLTTHKTMPIVLILSLLLGGSASYAAERSLPGDILYPVKVEVNENVRGLLTISPEAKAQWQVRLVERRLEEVEKLAKENKLDDKRRVQIESNFERYAERARVRIERLSERKDFRGATEASSNFEISLKRHELILERIGNQRPEIESTIKRVQQEVSDIANARGRIEVELSTAGNRPDELKVTAEEKLKDVENEIEETRLLLERKIELLDKNTIAQAKDGLESAENTITEGKAKLEAGSYGEAFILFQKAMRMTSEVKSLIEIKIEEVEKEESPRIIPRPAPNSR